MDRAELTWKQHLVWAQDGRMEGVLVSEAKSQVFAMTSALVDSVTRLSLLSEPWSLRWLSGENHQLPAYLADVEKTRASLSQRCPVIQHRPERWWLSRKRTRLEDRKPCFGFKCSCLLTAPCAVLQSRVIGPEKSKLATFRLCRLTQDLLALRTSVLTSIKWSWTKSQRGSIERAYHWILLRQTFLISQILCWLEIVMCSLPSDVTVHWTEVKEDFLRLSVAACSPSLVPHFCPVLLCSIFWCSSPSGNCSFQGH